MNQNVENRLLTLALLTAAASSIHIVEGLIMRMLPLPFIRLGLSNVVVLYLVWNGKFMNAIAVNVAKALIGGLFTLTLLSPSTLLSISGGLIAVVAMQLSKSTRMGFSIYGISIIGAIAHNLTQLVVVRNVIIRSDSVFMLTPFLISIGLLSGFIIAYITLYAEAKFKLPAIERK
ncbi:MAG: Gx transporter family protein [Candidatus Cloacimonetes bacterium]|nr:Gx transporter family protein [Candidatus Cloacimonadota bacterium]MDD3236053.1 Gx transporter family protein [Candidatus Cloacimonadota bacterium]